MFLFMEDRHSIDVMNRPDANVIPQSWACRDLDGARLIAQEIFAEDHAYTLNVLLLCQDDALRALSISFDSMKALA